MRRLPAPSAQVGSSPVEMLLLIALAVVIAGGLVGVSLLVTLQPSSEAVGTVGIAQPVPSVPTLEIACGLDGGSLGGEAVDATAAGVPVEVAGDGGAALSFTSPGVPAYRMGVFAASGRYTLPLAPGSWTVGCAGSGAAADSAALGTFEVRDPEGAYLRARPDCPPEGCCDDILALPSGFADDDLGALHAGLTDAGVLPTDMVERAAYPESSFSTQPPNPLVYRVVRDRRIVARVDVAGEGDAWSASVHGCPAA